MAEAKKEESAFTEFMSQVGPNFYFIISIFFENSNCGMFLLSLIDTVVAQVYFYTPSLRQAPHHTLLSQPPTPFTPTHTHLTR